MEWLVSIGIVGDAGVGKSSIVQQHFSKYRLCPKELSVLAPRSENIDGNHVFVCALVQPEGHDKDVFRSGHGVLIVFDLTNRSSLANVPTWLDEIEQIRGSKLMKVLVGNKRDLVDKRVVSHEEAEGFATTHGMKYFETTLTDHDSTWAPFDFVVRTTVKANEDAMSKLHRAALKGDVVGIEQVLHEEGIDEIDKPDSLGFTAIHCAVKNGHMKAIEALVRLGSKAIDVPNNDDQIPMVFAMMFRQIQVMETLVQLGSKALDDRSRRGTMFHACIGLTAEMDHRHSRELMETLVRLGSQDLDTPNENGETPIHFAASCQLGDSIETLVRMGSKAIDTPTNKGETPMHAAANGHVSVIELLVRLGSKTIDIPDNKGETPMHAAASYGHASAIEVLVRLGSKAIDTPNTDGCTPVSAAAQNGHASVIETLVRLGSKAIDTPNNENKTPMHAAITSGRPSAIETLVRLGSRALDSSDTFFARIHESDCSMGKKETLEVLKALGVACPWQGFQRVRVDEDEAAEVRYRVYFAWPLTVRLLCALESVP